MLPAIPRETLAGILPDGVPLYSDERKLNVRGLFCREVRVSEKNIAKLSKEDQDKVAVDLVASAVAYKERLNMPVVPEMVAREQPEHLQ